MAYLTADRYVSIENGSDLANGSTEALAWATVDKAATNAVAGETVAIAPGTYRETIVVDNAGSSGNEIKFVGDPKCLYFDNEKPGRVRITDTNAAEVPQQSAEGITSKQNYVEWHNIWTDGALEAIDFGSNEDPDRVAYDCVFTAKNNGVNTGSAVRCVAVAGDMAYGSCLTIQSIGLAGQRNYAGCISYNCLAIGGQYGFRLYNNAANIAHNCVALGCGIGYSDPGGAGGITNCYALFCNSGAASIAAGEAVSSYYHSCFSIDADFGSLGLMTLPNFRALLDLMPWLAESTAGSWLRQGDNTGPAFGATDVDIGGHRLRLKSAALDIGPWSMSAPPDTPYDDASPGMIDWGTLTPNGFPSLKVTTEGDIVLGKVKCEGDDAITITCQAKYDTITGNKPQLILRGDTIAEQVANMANGDDTWEELTVTATPDTADEALTVLLRARNTAGDCYFGEVIVSSGGGDPEQLMVRDLGGLLYQLGTKGGATAGPVIGSLVIP